MLCTETKMRLWAFVIALSCASTIAAVRLLRPMTLDEKLTVAVLLLLLPALLILLFAFVHRRAGLAIAILIPLFATGLVYRSTDPPLIWAVPLIAIGMIVTAAGSMRRKGPSRVAALVALAVCLAIYLWPLPGSPQYGPRVLLIGVDGATWKRVDPMLAEADLPHFQRLIDAGKRARLRSLPSLYSPRIWSSIATGCTPDVHGIKGFTYHQKDYKVGRIWDMMKHQGRSFGTCGYFFTWPPLPDLGPNDFMIPSFIAPDDQVYPPQYTFLRKFAAPGGLRPRTALTAGLQALRGGVRLSTLRRAIAFIVTSRVRKYSPLDSNYRGRQLYAAMQGDIFAELIRTRRPEFATVLFTQIDKVSHRYWKYVNPEGFDEVTAAQIERYGDAVNALYREIDRNLGKFIGSAPEDVDFIIVSDHGFRPLLRQVSGQFCRIRTENLLATLGMEARAIGTNVDQKVYLRAIESTEADRERTLVQLESILGNAHVVGEAQPLFEVTRDEGQLRLTIAPRDAFPENAEILLAGEARPVKLLIHAAIEALYSGEHHPDGIYIISGPAAARAVETDSLHVLNVAPTIAALLELPVSPRWTAPPALRDVSLSALEIADYPPPVGALADAPIQIDKDIKEKLRSIGYLQ